MLRAPSVFSLKYPEVGGFHLTCMYLGLGAASMGVGALDANPIILGSLG